LNLIVVGIYKDNSGKNALRIRRHAWHVGNAGTVTTCTTATGSRTNHISAQTLLIILSLIAANSSGIAKTCSNKINVKCSTCWAFTSFFTDYFAGF
jgi:hypothetical protein